MLPEPFGGRYSRCVTVKEMPPRGRYLAHEVGQLAGVPGRTIGQWARRGLIRSSQSEGPPRVYSYQDVAEAMVVHAMLRENVGHDAIRKTVQGLRAMHGHDWPLQHARLFTHPTHSGAKLRKRVVVVDGIDIPQGQPMLEIEQLQLIASDLRRGGWAARQLGDLRHIEVDPERHSGRPVVAGTRVPAEDAGRLADRPGGRTILRDDYGLTDEQIDDALRWWKTVSGFEQENAA